MTNRKPGKQKRKSKNKILDRLTKVSQIPTPHNWDSKSIAEKENYILDYVSNMSLTNLLRLFHSPKYKKFIYLSAEPDNINKDPHDIWIEAGYQTDLGFQDALDCLITQIAIKRLRVRNFKTNLAICPEILDKEDVLNILSSILTMKKIPLSDGRREKADNNVYLKALDILSKFHDLNNNKMTIEGDVKIEIQLPEQKSPQIEHVPLKEINAEVIDVEVEDEN